MNSIMDVALTIVMALMFVLITEWILFFDSNLGAYLSQ